MGYDKEQLDYEKISIGDQYEGLIFEKNNQYTIQWQQENYVFEITGAQSRKKLENIAASVKPVEE